MKTIVRVILVAVLVCGVGCARSDWIQQTLVTVDVTGVWSGELRTRGLSGGTPQTSTLSFRLEQHGAKVTGSFALSGGTTLLQGEGMRMSGPIEGTVAGDVFSFAQTNGALKGELTVSEDEMTGQGTTANRPVSISLRRVDSSAPPRSQ